MHAAIELYLFNCIVEFYSCGLRWYSIVMLYTGQKMGSTAIVCENQRGTHTSMLLSLFLM